MNSKKQAAIIKIQNLIKARQIEQVRCSYYQYNGENAFSDIPTTTALFPDGVICMDSALDYPIVEPYFVRTDRYPVGIVTGMIDGYAVKVYDKERTICDLLLHRNKIDGEILTRQSRDMSMIQRKWQQD